ncbi:thymidylate kinase [Streptomyces sp. NPDC055808]|uniref:thymidylate kinase n=1 Tax=Streptomyces sp. NPDC001828 TaxID=3364615 RepID=UPI0036A71F27
MIIALDGPDGAGKSTQLARLADWAGELGVSFRTVSKWQLFDETVMPEARFLRGSRQEEIRVCIAEMPSPARMLFLGWMNTMAAHYAAAAQEELVVLDGYWAKHAAAELISGTHRGLVEAIVEAIAPVDRIIYFDVAPEEALRRKKGDLAPYECGCDLECRPENFLRHQSAVREVLLGWAKEYDWSVIRTDSPGSAQQELKTIVAALLKDQ